MPETDPPPDPEDPLASTLAADAVARALAESGVPAQRAGSSAVQFGPVPAPALCSGRLLSGEAFLAVAGGELRFEARDGRILPRMALQWRPQLGMRHLFWPVVIALPLALAGRHSSAVLAAGSVFLALGIGESLLTIVRTPRYLRRLVTTEMDLVAFRQAHGLSTPERAS
jgi:hypothetical protein